MGGTIIHKSPVGWAPKTASSAPPLITEQVKAAMRRAADRHAHRKQAASDMTAYNQVSDYPVAVLEAADADRVSKWLALAGRVRHKLPSLSGKAL